ncbi:MAG TPA: hypothetical protein VGG37_03400 [Opitutaceae bacterium]
MENQKPKRVTAATIAVDAVLVVVFFLYMYSVLSTHVPSRDHRMIVFWGLLATFCMSIVFWLTLQMFRAVIWHQRQMPKP